MSVNSEIDTSLIPDFVAEAVEHLEEMESALLKLEANPKNVELLNGIFRNIHTIKGAAQFIGLKQTSHLAHNAENLLDLLREGERSCTPTIIDILIHVKDRLGHLLREIEHTENEQTLVDDLVAAIVAQVENPTDGTAPVKVQTKATGATPKRQTPAPENGKNTTSVIIREPENYHEELDQELFAIFLQQLTEEMTNLRILIDRAKVDPVPGPLVLDCVTSLEKLKSSANYMGYEYLMDLYDRWTRALYASLGNEESGLDALEDYFAQIIKRFPELGPVLIASKPIPVTAQIPETQATTPKQVVTSPPAAPLPPTVAPQPTQVAQQLVTAPDTAADALFAQLNAALKAAATHTPSTINTDMELGFEELTDIVGKPTTPADTVQSAAKPPEVLPQPLSATQEEMVQDVDDDELPPPKITRAENKSASKDEKDATPGGERALKRSVRVDADKIDTLMNQVGELIVHRSYFNQIHNELVAIQRRLDELGVDPLQAKALRTLSYRYGEAIVSLSRTANELQEGVMKVRMLPIAQLFNRYPRLVHDLVRHSEKKVRLEMRGEDTELDKMIIEEVSDPLIHIIRNAVDHGFETTLERKRLGKPEVGTLVLDAYHESNHIVIKITDDGRGIDPRKVGAKAIEKGLITEAELERMSPRDIMRLIMQAGFSTAEAITNTSGRGVGMDVVRKNIEKLNGSVEIDSDVGSGTRFRLKIPLTLAIISALQVRVGDTHFTIPLANVEETLRVFNKDTSIIEGVEVVQLRGHTMPIFRLASVFGINSDERVSGGRFFVVIVNTGSEKVGLVVDELLGQDEVVIKPLIDFLQEKSGFSGATIIGGGRISLILDVYELVKMTAKKQARFQQQLAMRRRQQMSQALATR